MSNKLHVNFDAPKMRFAFMDDLEKIQVALPFAISIFDGEYGGFAVYSEDDDEVALKGVFAEDNPHHTWEVTIAVAEKLDVRKRYMVYHPHMQPKQVWFRKVLDREEFVYTGDDLGPTYTLVETRFRVWAPTANRVEVLIYDWGDAVEAKPYDMQPAENGTWYLAIQGNLKGKFYTYKVHVHGYQQEAVDPYVRAVNVNGTKGAIIDLKDTNPAGWGSMPRPTMESFVDTIIYETHIRDISIAENSGIKHKGKYLALTEEGTKSPEGYATGLDHLKELGITHVHLLPLMESEFIRDDENCYNWGYGTNFFFATEGQYATNPADPVLRVKEFKEAVQALHRNGIRVVLDVVYNHTGRENPDIERIVPGYYLRRDEEGNLSCGSGVNNDFASERPMARKLMVDSAKYWLSEYQVDGFRFDLMGLHDRKTMEELTNAVHEMEPTFILYGEAWNIQSNELPFSEMMIKNAQQGTPIGIFNDNVRDSVLRGGLTPVTERGFANGRPGIEASIKKVVVGSIKGYDPEHVLNVEYRWSPMEVIETLAPHETINYVTCHDNYAMRDRLERSNPEVSDEERQRISMLANGIILTSQGIPFIAGGVELWKTKQGEENSYEAPDYINEIDWSHKAKYLKMFKYYQGLIRLRKEHPAFRMRTAEDIKKHLLFLHAPQGMVIYTLHNHANGDPWKNIIVLYNQNQRPMTVHVPGESWTVVVEDGVAGVEPLRIITGNLVEVPPVSVMVMHHE